MERAFSAHSTLNRKGRLPKRATVASPSTAAGALSIRVESFCTSPASVTSEQPLGWAPIQSSAWGLPVGLGMPNRVVRASWLPQS
ncbi:hypothetical protein D3C76_1596340 [compost metagenome]